MTDDKCCPPPKEVQDFLFKQSSFTQACEEFQCIPNYSNLVAADGKRGLIYLGHDNKLIVIKPENESGPEWKLELDLPDRAVRVALNCDYSFLAVTFHRPSALIYDVASINKHKLDILHEIRLSASAGEIVVLDLKWNPAIPEMLCSIASDHTIGCFQVSRDKKTGVQIIGMERIQGLEALCVSWSPKGKQLVVGCVNGDIVQLKPELKLARHLTAPNPPEGIVISILWVSNYQFCACYYQKDEQRIGVMIVDAPKGVTAPKYTNYEDVTFGSGPKDNLSYYFEHIPEWGIIIAASTHSCEVAVLGTLDNGATWNLWQLMDDSTAQLPLNRKKQTENYPLGLGIDKAITQKLPWGTDNTLPNPVPVLRILVTSGQLCCYHMVNLKGNIPVICSPPTEIIAVPQLPRPSLGPGEISFNLPTGATSTPRPKQPIIEPQVDKQILPTNTFGDPNAKFSFLAPSNKATPEPQREIVNVGFPAATEAKKNEAFTQGETKTVFQDPKTNKSLFPTPIEQQAQPLPTYQQPELKPAGLITTEPKAPIVNLSESKITKEPAKELTEETKSKEVPVYGDGVYLRAYYEELAKFEKELKSKLDTPSWTCGTEEERQLLVKKSEEIDEFLRELRETTNSLSSDIAYLKALLLQSFAWIEETKSKNSANVSVGSRNRSEGNKLADIQRLYYYTQSQLIQATKVLDLEWAEFNNREMSRMKIPSLEVIYQSLIRYRQIINQERKNLEDLSKKWRLITRGNSSLSVLDRSMASLNLSQSSEQINDTAIELRCKLIATSTRNFSRDKQMKLRDLLAESAPRIIRAVRPTAVQDRLEATLSQLASLKAAETIPKLKPSKPAVEQQKTPMTKPVTEPIKTNVSQVLDPLSSLDNFVLEMGNTGVGVSKSASSISPFSFSNKPTSVSPQQVIKPKENIFTQSTVAAKPFNKTESIAFGTKPPESQVSKENVTKSPIVDTSTNKFSMFPPNTFGKLGTPESSTASTTILSVPKTTFSFSSPSTTPKTFASFPKLDNSSVFQFSSKTATPQNLSTSLDLNFATRPGLIVTPASEAKTTSAQPLAINFGYTKTPTTQSPIFGQTTAQPIPTTVQSFGTPTVTAVSSPDKTLLATPATTTASTAFGTSTVFGGLSAILSEPSFNATATPALTTSKPITTVATSAVPTMSFGSSATPATTAPVSATSFGGLLGATSALSFGAPSAQISITPTFSKGTTPTSNVFGSTVPSTTVITATSTTTSTPTSTIFASSTNTTPNNAPIFASPTTTTASTSVFSNANSPAPSLFGGQTTVATTSAENSFFNTKTPSASSTIFGGGSSTGSTFGNSTTSVFAAGGVTSQPNNVFGNNASTPSSGTSMFGGTSTVTSGFGGTSPPFGATTPATTSAAVFGNASNTGSIFGSSAPGTSVFGSNAAPTSSIFGSTTTTPTSSIFGATTTTPGTSMFGTPAATATATTPPSGSMFGAASPQPAASNVFGAASPSSVFGSPSTLGGGASMFGGSATFGQPAAFGAKPVFGSPSGGDFNAAKPTFGSGFGSPPAFGAAASPGFGNPSILGPGSPIGGTSPSKVFGSSTFEALGAQTGGLSFGSLAQTTNQPEKPQAFQGSSSFSSWR